MEEYEFAKTVARLQRALKRMPLTEVYTKDTSSGERLWSQVKPLLDTTSSVARFRKIVSVEEGRAAFVDLLEILQTMVIANRDQEERLDAILSIAERGVRKRVPNIRTKSISLLGILLDSYLIANKKQEVFRFLMDILKSTGRRSNAIRDDCCTSLMYSYISLSDQQRQEFISELQTNRKLEHLLQRQDVQDLFVMDDRRNKMREIAEKSRKWWEGKYEA